MFCSDQWNAVPRGSVLNVRFTREKNVAVAGQYRVIRPNGSTDDTPIDSNSFPLDRKISAGERHEVEFRGMFQGGEEADVALVATVVRPDQTVLGQPYRCSGTLNDEDPLCTVELFANGAS